MEGNACLKAKLTFPSVPQNKTIESVLRWNRKGECLFWVFISCRKLPSYVISLTAGSQNGPQYSSRKIYHRGKATSFRQIHVHVLRRFIRNKIGQINYPIQHFQGKQSKPETHKYFKRRSFSKNLAEIKCLWPRRVTNKCIRTILTDHAWGKLICFPCCIRLTVIFDFEWSSLFWFCLDYFYSCLQFPFCRTLDMQMILLNRWTQVKLKITVYWAGQDKRINVSQ